MPETGSGMTGLQENGAVFVASFIQLRQVKLLHKLTMQFSGWNRRLPPVASANPYIGRAGGGWQEGGPQKGADGTYTPARVANQGCG